MHAKTTQSRPGNGNIGDTMKTFHQPWNYLAVFRVFQIQGHHILKFSCIT